MVYLPFSYAASVALNGNIVANLEERIDFNGSVIEKIKRDNMVVIGYRESAVPMSFVINKESYPEGYAIDICNQIIEKMKVAFNLPNLNVEYQLIDPATRFLAVRKGLIDLECGSTTNNKERRQSVAFSMVYMISGSKIMTRSDSSLSKISDLNNKVIVYAKGTSQEKIVKKLNDVHAMNMKVIEAVNFQEAVNKVANKEADAFILDDVLLVGEKAKYKNPEVLNIVGDYLSIEPLAIMLSSKDKQLKTFVDKQLVEMTLNGFLEKNYIKWFQSPIAPNNKSLNIEPNELFKDLLRMPNDITGN